MNNSSLKVLIGDDSAAYGTKIASELRKQGIYAYTRKNSGNAILNSILSETPDVVISDLTMTDYDSLELIRRSKSVLSQCPIFIVTSEINNSFIERQVLEGGASYFLPKPCDPAKISEIVRLLGYKKTGSETNDAELMVTELIQKLGVPAHIKGYRYMRTAILECLENKDLLDNFTKNLYPTVACRYETTPSRVERAIRHAIDTAWTRGKEEELNSFFGYSIDRSNGRPTNSEVIALAADTIFLRLKRSSEQTVYSYYS